MSTVHQDMLECSLQAALASIELYNKPDFKYREQLFTITNVNAWELLLKAKIVQDSGDNLTALYIPHSGGGYKSTRSGNPMTLELLGCVNKLAHDLDTALVENINALVAIRDTAVHFYHSQSLSYVIYALGVASLRNYQKKIKQWWGNSLRDYNFYILPLAFAYNFQTLSLLELETEPEVISNLIRAVSETQASVDQSTGYFFTCEVRTEIKSAKSFAGMADFTTVIDPNADPETPIVIKTQLLTDKYPLSYLELVQKIKAAKSGVKQHQIDKIIRDHKMKDDERFAIANYRTNKQKDTFKKTGVRPTGVPYIYNQDALRYITEHVEAEN